MSSGNGGDDARSGSPEAGAGSEQEVVEMQEGDQGDHSPRSEVLHMDEEDEALQADENSEFMQNFSVDRVMAALDETHGALGDQRQPVPPPHPADQSPTQEPEPKRAHMDASVEVATSPAQVSNLPYPVVDALILKDVVPNLEIDLADRQAHMLSKFGPRYKLVGAVAHFYHVHSYVDSGLVDERQGHSATVDECADVSDWYPVSDIAGAVIGCDPREVHLLSEPVWTYITGLIGKRQVGPYPIVGLYTGIDLTGISPQSFGPDEDFKEAELQLAIDQGTAFARFAALAAQYHLPLTVYAGDKQGNKLNALDILLNLLQRVPGFSRTHRICLSEFLYFPHQAERFIRIFPNTVIGITHEFVQDMDADTKDWLRTVPWQFLAFQSMAPALRGLEDSDGDCNDSSDCITYLARYLAETTGETRAVIIQKMTEAAISHYGLLAVNRKLLEGTKVNPAPTVLNKPTVGGYHERLQSRPGGPPAPLAGTEDVIQGIAMPPKPWNVPHQAVDEPAPVMATQPGPLPEVEFVAEVTGPWLDDPFTVRDDTQTWFEYLRRCPDHGQRRGVRHHPNIRSTIPGWVKFENDKEATADQRGLRQSLGFRTVNGFGKMHLVFAASRFMRHHANRVVQFLDAITATWNKQELEAHVDQFFREIRANEVARSTSEINSGKRKPEEAINPAKIKFGNSEVLQALRFWSLRCQPARKYYEDHPHGPASYHTEFLISNPAVDASIRQSFKETLLDTFSTRIDHARLRTYLEEVTEEFPQRTLPNGEPDWPPRLLEYQVDYRRTYWSKTVVLMDNWAKTHFSGQLRPDVDALQFDADPTAAGEEVHQLFFAGSVEQIVLFYGKDSLDLNKVDQLVTFYSWVIYHLTDTFSRAQVYLVVPPFIYFKMDGWRDAVLTLINSADLKQRATVVHHPVDVRLMTYYEMHGTGAAWPAEVSSVMDKAANLSREGIRERKEFVVENYDLYLWTDEGLAPEFVLSTAELLERSENCLHETVRHFGVPTVSGTRYDSMRKPSEKKAWKPHPGQSMSRPDSQQSLAGSQRDLRVRRQSERSEASVGGYPARSTGNQGGHFAQSVNPPRASQLPPPPRVDPFPADQRLTVAQIQQLVDQSLARQRAEFEALLAQREVAAPRPAVAPQPLISQAATAQPAPQSTIGRPRPAGYRGVSREAATAFRQRTSQGSTPSPFVPGSAQADPRMRRDSTHGRRSDARPAQSLISTAPPLIAVAATTSAASPASTLQSTTPPTSTASSGTSSSSTGTSSATTISSTSSTETTGTSGSSSATPKDRSQ